MWDLIEIFTKHVSDFTVIVLVSGHFDLQPIRRSELLVQFNNYVFMYASMPKILLLTICFILILFSSELLV